jgi:hypothetical protein
VVFTDNRGNLRSLFLDCESIIDDGQSEQLKEFKNFMYEQQEGAQET